MYAVRDDLPFPHRARHRRGLPLLAVTTLGGALIAAALYLPNPLAASAPPVLVAPQASVPTPAPMLAAPSPPAPATRRRPLVEPTTKPSAATAAPQIHAYRPPAPPTAPTARQTTFNEHNYRPREIVNRLPAQRSLSVERKARPQKTRTRAAKWSWKTRDGIVRGTFKWSEHNGRIDFASVCLNEGAGSLRYRDCRKGAKVAFARLCRERRDPAACHAENNYSALR